MGMMTRNFAFLSRQPFTIRKVRRFVPHYKLQADLAAAKSPAAQTHLARDIAATDRAIDQLIYQFYGLTAEEIALVEATTAAPATKSAPPADDDKPAAPVVAPPPPEAYIQAESDAAHHFMAKEDPPPTH